MRSVTAVEDESTAQGSIAEEHQQRVNDVWPGMHFLLSLICVQHEAKLARLEKDGKGREQQIARMIDEKNIKIAALEQQMRDIAYGVGKSIKPRWFRLSSRLAMNRCSRGE